MTEETNQKDKSITLTKLKPQDYRLWAMTARATLGVHGLLDIVESRDLDPTPVNPDGTPGVPTAQQRSKIQKWKRNHELAREALLKSLESPELLKISAVHDSAPAIWNRLQQEYGRPLRTEYVRALSAFYALRKDGKTS